MAPSMPIGAALGRISTMMDWLTCLLGLAREAIAAFYLRILVRETSRKCRSISFRALGVVFGVTLTTMVFPTFLRRISLARPASSIATGEIGRSNRWPPSALQITVLAQLGPTTTTTV